MPKGYQGFQKGHKGFMTPEDYTKRKKPVFSPEGLAVLQKCARKVGLANKGKSTSKKGKHNPKWSEASKRAWATKRANPEKYKVMLEKQRLNGVATLAKLCRTSGTWIEIRFEEFLTGFGLIKGEHFLVQPTVYTETTYRFPDFLLANNVIIEVDGSQWHTPEKDKARDKELRKVGFKIFHFTEVEIRTDPIGCCDKLVRIINDHTLESTHA